MLPQLILLYGAPAVGKDTVSRALSSIEPSARLFKKAKMGTGRTEGYQMITERPDPRDVVSSVKRYDNEYYVLGSALKKELESGVIPILHTTSVAEVESLQTWAKQHAYELRTCALTHSFSSFWSRSVSRGDDDTDSRSRVWFSAYDDLTRGEVSYDLVINTEDSLPETTARQILMGREVGGKCWIHSPIAVPGVKLSAVSQVSEYVSALSTFGADIIFGGPTSRWVTSQPEAADELAQWEEYFPANRIIIAYETLDHWRQSVLPTSSPHIVKVRDRVELEDAAKEGVSGVYLDANEELMSPAAVSVLENMSTIKVPKVFNDTREWRTLSSLGTIHCIESSAQDLMRVTEVSGSDTCTAVNLNICHPDAFSTLSTLQRYEQKGRALRNAPTSEERLLKLESLIEPGELHAYSS